MAAILSLKNGKNKEKSLPSKLLNTYLLTVLVSIYRLSRSLKSKTIKLGTY